MVFRQYEQFGFLSFFVFLFPFWFENKFFSELSDVSVCILAGRFLLILPQFLQTTANIKYGCVLI